MTDGCAAQLAQSCTFCLMLPLPCREPRYDNAGAPILVVAPTSVLSNWEREFETWGRFRWAWGVRAICSKWVGLQDGQLGEFETRGLERCFTV